MAQIYQCDRCGKLFDPTFDFMRPYSIVKSQFKHSHIDLCNSCYKEFRTWLWTKQDNKKEELQNDKR
jgi:DNA-directed RNA polymerase subunit RPC12/RpoP